MNTCVRSETTYIIKDTEWEHLKNDACFDRLGFSVLSPGLSFLLLDVSLVFKGQLIISDNCIKHDLFFFAIYKISKSENTRNLLFLQLNLEFLNFHREILG